ncbi:hypothetical protein ABZP36_023726 [Zizania latifolia]
MQGKNAQTGTENSTPTMALDVSPTNQHIHMHSRKSRPGTQRKLYKLLTPKTQHRHRRKGTRPLNTPWGHYADHVVDDDAGRREKSHHSLHRANQAQQSGHTGAGHDEVA